MMADAANALSTGASVDDSETLRSVLASSSEGREPDTLAALDQFPRLGLEKSMLLDLAYEEYTLKLKQGMDIDLDAFCARFPEHRSSVRKMIEVHRDLQGLSGELAAVPTAWPEAGALLGDYRLLRQLGRGGFARVFHAVHLLTSQHLVVKVAPGNFKESRLLGQFNHPNVAAIRDARVVGGFWSVLVMPYVGNSTLVDLLDVAFPHHGAVARGRGLVLRAARRNRQPDDPPVGDPQRDGPFTGSEYLPAVLRLASEVAEGLEYLHSRKILHRDLKPSNVLLSWNGHPIILDFNLAESSDDEQPGVAGTLYYMAPEQIEGGLSKENAKECTERADLFSFGVIVYEILTGIHPFCLPDSSDASNSNEKSAELARRLLDRQRAGSASPRQHDSAIDPAVDRLVMRCLSFEPAGRPESARDIRRELQRIQGLGHRWVRTLRNHFKLFALGGCIAVAGASYPTYSLVTRPPYKVRAVEHARRLAVKGKLEQARDELDEILNSDKDNVDARFLRGRIRLRLKQYEYAVYDFSAVWEQAPGGDIHALLAYVYGLRGAADAAIAHADIAEMKFQVSSPALFNNRAYCRYKSLGGGGMATKIEAIHDDLKRCLYLDPNFGPAYFNRAELEYYQYQNSRKNAAFLERAIKDIDQAIGLGFITSKSSYFAAIIHMAHSKGGAEQAAVLEHLRRACDLGRDLKPLTQNRNFKPLLADPEFLALVQKSQGGQNGGNLEGLVDPLPERVP